MQNHFFDSEEEESEWEETPEEKAERLERKRKKEEDEARKVRRTAMDILDERFRSETRVADDNIGQAMHMVRHFDWITGGANFTMPALPTIPNMPDGYRLPLQVQSCLPLLPLLDILQLLQSGWYFELPRMQCLLI